MSSSKVNKYTHTSLREWPFSILKGAIIGVGAILPGISGGVLCVVFGVYEPMMELLSHPIRAFKSYYKFFIPILIGWVLGFLGLARLVDLLFKNSPTPAVCLFIGLIVGTIPSLYRATGKHGRTKASWVSLGLSFALSLALLLYLQFGANIKVEPSVFWWLICGGLWGISLVVPGLSSSALLIFLGLYQPMTEGLSNLDFSVIAPLIIGLILCVVLLARVVNHMLKTHYSVMFSAILGVVVASAITIIPYKEFALKWDLLIYFGCFLLGAIVAYFMDKLGTKYETEGKMEES